MDVFKVLQYVLAFIIVGLFCTTIIISLLNPWAIETHDYLLKNYVYPAFTWAIGFIMGGTLVSVGFYMWKIKLITRLEEIASNNLSNVEEVLFILSEKIENDERI